MLSRLSGRSLTHNAAAACHLIRSMTQLLTFFVPKGEFESDPVAICREPLETRPLSLKNSDNEICAAVVNRSMADVVKQGTHKTQNGFVSGRQLIQNPVDLDAAGRLFSMIADDENKRKTTPSLEPPASFRSHLH